MSAIYRVEQFLRAAGTWIRPAKIDESFLEQYLPAEAVRLFRAMPRYDQRHALSVLHILQQQGHSEPDLAAAALLHDVGKTVSPQGRLRLWHRVAVVLMESVRPDLLLQLGREEAGSWRRPFFVQANHAAIGAELARQAGCSLLTVDLIRHHEDKASDWSASLLAALQAADAVS